MDIGPLQRRDIGQFLTFIRQVSIPYRILRFPFLLVELLGKVLPVSWSMVILELLRKLFDFEIWLSKKEGQLAGVMIISGRRRIWIVFVGTHPRFRRQGIATALFDKVFAKAKRKRIPIGLTVRKRNEPARNLYEKLGFKRVGEGPMHYKMVKKFVG